MGAATVYQDRFSRMVRDVSRDNLPRDAVYDMADFLPDLGSSFAGAALNKRGGWSYASPALTGVLTGADYVQAVHYAPFTAGDQLLAVVHDTGAPATKLAQVVDSSNATDRSTCNFPEAPLAFFRNKVYIPSQFGSANLDVYDGSSSVTDATGSPPQVKFVAVYKDRLVGAYTSSNKERVWFSGAGDATSWDTTKGWIDTSAPVHGLYVLRNAILVFHKNHGLEKIIGDIPPPGTNMSLQSVAADATLADIRGAAGTEDFCVFPNTAGVFMTDGNDVNDLTEEGGIKNYWDEKMDALAAAGGGFNLSGGYFQNYYIIVLRGNTVFHAILVCHIPTRAWFRLTNITATMFARKISGVEELYWGDRGEPRVNTFHDIFAPSASTKNDGDGTAVLPTLESGFRRFRNGRGRVKHLYFNYLLGDAASDNPTITVSAFTERNSTGMVSVKKLDGTTEDPLPETSGEAYVRRRVALDGTGVAYGLTQNIASSLTRIYRVGVEAHDYTPSRR